MELNGDLMWTPPTLESRRGGLILIDASGGMSEGALKLICRQLRVLVTLWAQATAEGEARGKNAPRSRSGEERLTHCTVPSSPPA